MTDSKRLTQLRDAYKVRAQCAYDNFQDSGIPRYYSDYRRWEELADVCEQAMNGADELQTMHSAYCTLRQILMQGEEAEQFMSSSDLYEKLRKTVAAAREVLR